MSIFRILAKTLKSVRQDDTAASTVEYAMILGFIVLLMFIALTGLAQEVTQLWNDISTKSQQASAN